MNVLRCVSWEAVSSKAQASKDKVSLERQRETNLSAIKNINGIHVASLVVPGESRSIVLFEDACKKIDAYRQLKELVDTRAIDVLVCYTHSRLGREISLCESVIAYCLAGDVAIYDCSAPPHSLDPKEQKRNAGARLMSVIRSWESQNEVRQLTENARDGREKSVRNGNFPPGPKPKFWSVEYDTNGDYIFTVNEVEAEVAKEVIRLFLSGLGTPEIARRYGKNKAWAKYYIDQVRKLAGQVEINRKSERDIITATGKQPAIIDIDTMNRVLTETKSRAKSRRSVGTKHIYSRLVICGKCNHYMHIDYAIDRPTKKNPERKRSTMLVCNRCYRAVRTSKIDKAMAAWQQSLVAGEIAEYTLNNEPQHDRIARLTFNLEKLGKEKSRLITLYTQELIELTEYKNRLTQFQREETEINKEIDALVTQVDSSKHKTEAMSTLIDILQQQLSTLSAMEINSIYRACIQIVYTVNKEIDIQFI